ncbi:MAG TPA: MaoC family dehydratase [Candidatus Baltobacteraceae bacterium]|nr:MaoC family dehydratase [Candidatus Baltobacteraceae bacterium]
MPPLILETPQALKEFVGRELGVSEWFAVTQERISQFAAVTEDHQWIHEDRQRASRESPFGTTIAHGFLTLSLMSYLTGQVFQVRGGERMRVNYGLNRVRFPAPVPAEARIRAKVKLEKLRELADCLEAELHVTVEVENGVKPCCVAEWLARFYV